MMRWLLLACCFVLGACKTVTPPARPDVFSAAAGLPAPAAVPSKSAVATKPEPAAVVKPESGEPPREAALHRDPVEPIVPLAEATQPVIEAQAKPSREPRQHGAEPLPVPAPLALPPLQPARQDASAAGGALPLLLSPTARHNATNTAATLSAALPARGGVLEGRALAKAAALPLPPPSARQDAAAAGETLSLSLPSTKRPCATDAAVTVPAILPARGGALEGKALAKPAALPLPPSCARQGDAAAGGSLPLLSSFSAQHNMTNGAAQLPLTIPSWVANAQMEDAWREVELKRQAQTQKEREEQFQQIRNAFYHFLSVNAGE